MGFNDKKSKTVARLQPGDRILCYLSKVSAFVGVMEVAGPSYLDHTPIWSDGVFPVRLPVRIVTELPLVLAVPIHSLKGQLSFLPITMNSTGWTIYVRSSPRPWTTLDGETVEKALAARVTFLKSSAAGAATAELSQTKTRRKAKLPLTARVGRLIQRTEQLAAWQKDGSLTRLDLAFSRDQAEKIYVQDRMREHAGEIESWLEAGAHFYVCGDAKRMAKDVDAALREIIAKAGGKSTEQAAEVVAKLKTDLRYQRDVY